MLKVSKAYTLWAVALMLALLAAYFVVGAQREKARPPGMHRDTEVAQHDLGVKITPNTVLLQKITYVKCGDQETFRTHAADNLLGKNFQQVQQVYGGWNIEKFDIDEVVMSLQVDALCPEHANNMFVGLKDGYVAVYYGRPGPKALLKEVTKVAASSLMEQDREELQRGVVVHSQEELLRTLEGLQAR